MPASHLISPVAAAAALLASIGLFGSAPPSRVATSTLDPEPMHESIGSHAASAVVPPAAEPQSAPSVEPRSVTSPLPPPAVVAERPAAAARSQRPADDIATRAPAAALLLAYQRVGRELALLKQSRGTSATLDLYDVFHAIHVETASTTAASRAEATQTLQWIHEQIDRRKGIDLDDACLHSPLARGCQ